MPDGSSLPEIKISQLPVAPAANLTDQLEANQSGVTRSITVAQIAALSPPPDLSDYVTDEELAAAIGAIPPPPTTLPPSGLAGGDLAGFYPNPALKLSVGLLGVPTAPTAAQNTNTTQLATCEFVNLELGGQLGFFLPLSGGTLTGPLHGTTADYTSTTPGAKVLSATGTTTSAAQDYFDVKLLDATGGAGSAMRVLGGPTGTNPLYQVDRAGDTQVSGWHRALSLSAPVAGGADYFAYYLGNGAGGNLGLFGGIGAPTFSTFGAKGAIYMDMAGAVPWYNVDGGTTWAKVGTGSGGSTITVSDTAPGSPTAGALWWNSVLGTLFIYYQDPNTSQWVPAAPAGANKLLQEISVETGAVATGTTLIPFDDTIPQITEGNEYMTLAITPLSATSKLAIEVVWNGTSSALSAVTVALFQDAGANALAVTSALPINVSAPQPYGFRHVMTSGTTSPTTFRVRAGCNAAGTTTFNGQGGARLYGGAMASSIVIREIAP